MRNNMETCIIGINVMLVPYLEKHVERYHEWMKCPTLRYLTGSDALTLAEEYEMQKRWLEDKDKCTFIILDKTIYQSTGNIVDAMIGDTNLFLNNSEDLHTAEVEIMIADTAHRNKKRGWESIMLMMRYGIEELNIHKYYAKIKLDNAISTKLFEKLGFQQVGKSEVFQEVTFEKEVSCDWKNWLNSELSSECKTIKLVDK